MGIQKSIQYSIYCENYVIINDDGSVGGCNQYEDYNEYKSPQATFKKMGYRHINGKWYCKACAEKISVNDKA